MRRGLIAERAYFIAQARGLGPGHELDDWLAAETAVNHSLSVTNDGRGDGTPADDAAPGVAAARVHAGDSD
jgi:hypothetical protein